MNRYVEKNILCQYELDEKLFEKLNIQVYDIIPLRKVFVLFTDKGKKILKLCTLSDKELNFIKNSLDYVSERDSDILKYYLNEDNEIVTEWNGKRYVVLDMIDGREVVFTNPIEISKAAEAIALMHKASHGIEDYLVKMKVDYEKNESVIDRFTKDLGIINNLKNMVKKYKYMDEFDSLFLNEVEVAERQMDSSINNLYRSNFLSLIEDKEKKCLCHNDLAHHNFIISGDKINIIDFDYCNIDTRIMDISNFTSKVIKSLAYDKEVVKLIFKSYGKISKIDIDEIRILMELISYPSDFVSISKLFYFKEKPWDEEVFINRLKNKIDLEIFRREFLSTPMGYFIN